METLKIDILNPKAKSLLQDLADLNLIKIQKDKVKSEFRELIGKLRMKSAEAPSLGEINEKLKPSEKPVMKAKKVILDTNLWINFLITKNHTEDVVYFDNVQRKGYSSTGTPTYSDIEQLSFIYTNYKALYCVWDSGSGTSTNPSCSAQYYSSGCGGTEYADSIRTIKSANQCVTINTYSTWDGTDLSTCQGFIGNDAATHTYCIG